MNTSEAGVSPAPPPEPNAALITYFSDPKFGATKVVKALNAQSSPTFTTETEATVREKLSGFDPDLKRALALTVAGFSCPKLTTATVLMGWAAGLVANEMNVASDWSPKADVVESYRDICARLKPSGKERKLSKRSTNLLLIAALWLSYNRQLDVRDVLASIIGVLPRMDDPEQSTRKLSRAVTKFISSKPSDLPGLLDLAQLWIVGNRAVRSQLTSAEEEIQTLSRQLSQANTEEATLRQHVSELEAQTATQSETLRSLRSQLGEKDDAHHHSSRELKVRFAGFLEGLQQRQVADIANAVEFDPIQTDVIRERLKIVGTNIARELQWLRSSD